MTFASAGSATIDSTSKTFTLNPGTLGLVVGNFIVYSVWSETSADPATAMSSSNATWSVLAGPTTLGTGASTVFIGEITSTSSATVSITTAGSPTVRSAGWPFSTTAGFANVALDTSGTVNASTLDMPSLTPAKTSGELYFCFCFAVGTGFTPGSTPGISYEADANSNPLAFDAACGSTGTAVQPVWSGTASTISGIAVLLYEKAVTPSSFAPPPKPSRGRPAARKSRTARSAGAPVVLPVPGLGLFRTEAGGRFRTEDGGFLFTEDATTPSPFAPAKAARGKPAARKSRLSAPAPSAPSAAAPVTPAPFTVPPKPSRGKASARKARLASSAGAPVVIPSPFAVPATPARGKRAAGKSRSAGSAGAPLVLPPPTPSPFAAPAKPAKGKPAAARARLANSPGSPVVAPPPITPSPFTLPAAIARAHAAVRRARLALSPGSPAVLSVSPFAVPPAAKRGKPAARKSRLASSPGAPLVIPSPFTPPSRAARGKAAARKARTASSAGSPVVLPTGSPSPFVPPARPARGRPAAGKSRLRSSAGSPAVIPGWTIIGTMAQTATTSLALTPAHAGDLIFVDIVSVGAPPTGISGGGCTWQQVGTTLTGVTNAGDYAAAYEGTVVTTGSATATLAFSGTPTTIRCVAQEAQSSTGAWIVDGPQGNLDSSGTNTLPSLTPSAPGDLYIGYTFDNSTATAGTTPGYTYDIDSHGNGLAFNPDCGSGAQAPVWGTSTCAIGISVLFKAVVPSPPATPASFSVPAKPARGKAAARKARTAFSAGSPAVVAPPPPPFPQSPLDLRAELNLSGTWTDVSTYAYQRDGSSPPVTITRGKPDESSTANPASCSWQLNNRDGRFSPRNPLSPYYGQLIRNTPVRWSVLAASSYLRTEDDLASGASCPDAVPLRISGDLDVRVDVQLSDWQGAGDGLDFLGANWASFTNAGWMLGTTSEQTGLLVLNWSVDGVNTVFARSSLPPPLGRAVLRATLAVATGTVTFYTAPAGGIASGPWTQLGAEVTSGATTLYPAAAGLQIGGAIEGTGFYGRLYAARVLSGIGGTTVASPDFATAAAGATGLGDGQGNTWTVTGTAEVSDREYRFHGEMSQMPPKWDVTGNDMWVAAQAGGPLRRLSQGTNNAMSAIKRAILLQTGAFVPVAYWPMEDAAGASVFGSAVGGPPITFDQSPAPVLATDSSFTCSAPLPQLNGSRLQATVPPYDDTGTWTVRFLLNLSPPAADATLLRIVSSPWAACPVVYINVDTAGDLELVGYEPGGSEAFNTGYVNFAASGTPLMISVEAQPASGGNTQYSLVAVAPGASTGGDVGGTASGSAGTVSVAQPDVTGAFTSTVMGHLQVQSAWQTLFTYGQPLNAWTGEAAAARYARLCQENGYQVRIIGAPATSVVMGPQGQDTLQDLLQEVETTDLGQQFEPRSQLALGYRTLASMCSQSPALELDYAASEPGGVSGDGTDNGLDPSYDDLLSKNDWTVTRGAASGPQGATVEVALSDGSAMSTGSPPNGMGDYANSQTVNTEYDGQLQDVAGWMVHTGTVDDLRWPVIPVNLARPEMAALLQDAVALDIGDMVQVDSLPDAVLYDPVKQVVLGTKESLGGFHWTHEYNAVPESAYEVVILGDPVYGRVDTDGSQLASGVSATATTLSVAITGPSGILWSPLSADWPFDIAVGGERMTVTAVSGTTSPQSLTVTRSVNGVVKAQAAGTDVRLWFPPILSLT